MVTAIEFYCMLCFQVYIKLSIVCIFLSDYKAVNYNDERNKNRRENNYESETESDNPKVVYSGIIVFVDV